LLLGSRPQRKGRNWMPHLVSCGRQYTKIYGFRDRRATITRACCTTGQMLRLAAKVAWPDCPKAIEPRFIGAKLFRWYQRRTWRGAESPDHFLSCIGTKSTRVGVFCIHRRKCHLAGAFASAPGWSDRISM
jgi:hypothetical protein